MQEQTAPRGSMGSYIVLAIEQQMLTNASNTRPSGNVFFGTDNGQILKYSVCFEHMCKSTILLLMTLL